MVNVLINRSPSLIQEQMITPVQNIIMTNGTEYVLHQSIVYQEGQKLRLVLIL
jgi:hypothetical protein